MLKISRARNTKKKSELRYLYASEIIMPIWTFFNALYHVLQEGENGMSAIDAFWLGLIDGVIGETNLPTFRQF